MNTGELNDHFRRIWDLCPDDFPGFRHSYGTGQQKEREAILNGWSGKLKQFRNNKPDQPLQVDTDKFFAGFREVLHKVYGYSDQALSIILHPGMIAASKSFFSGAREFDPGLTKEEIFQAMRNSWIMNGLQLLLNLPPGTTPSIFGYSLLYPYTDNLLDDPLISRGRKETFNAQFRERLLGNRAEPSCFVESCIYALVEKIESQYPRDSFPEVYESLLAIHKAQHQSLKLMGPDLLTTDEITSLNFEKGGASVLADGFLVGGTLPEPIQQFCYGYGIWLQLFDDIQDLAEDAGSGTRTLFTQSKDKPEIVRLVNRTLHFGRAVIDDINCFPAVIKKQFGEVILYSLETMLIQAVGLNHTRFPGPFLAEMETYSPVSYRFLRSMRKKGGSGRLQLISQLAGIEESS